MRTTRTIGREPPEAERLRGLSLLEVTFSVALLTTLALSVAQLVVPVASQSRLNREVAMATASARRVLEQVQATPFAEILPTWPDGTEQAIDDLPGGRLTVRYEDPAADPLRMHLELSWDSPEVGPLERTFHTARTE